MKTKPLAPCYYKFARDPKIREKFFATGTKDQKKKILQAIENLKKKGEVIDIESTTPPTPAENTSETQPVKKSKTISAMTQKVKSEPDQGPTRQELMTEVRDKGVKLFRIMNKAELTEVSKLLQGEYNLERLPEDGNILTRIKAIQDEANQRWHSGWGAKGPQKPTQEPANTPA